MSSFLKIFGTLVAIALILIGGADFMVTTVPGIALLVAIWGLKLK